MVAGHSVYTSSRCEKVDEENAWYLQPYQKRLGQAATFVQHIQKGVEIVANDDVALLLFSGGETRKEAGPRSEAQSYYRNSGLLCGVLDMNPQLREIMQNPEILQQLTSPETMKISNEITHLKRHNTSTWLISGHKHRGAFSGQDNRLPHCKTLVGKLRRMRKRAHLLLSPAMNSTIPSSRKVLQMAYLWRKSHESSPFLVDRQSLCCVRCQHDCI